VNNEQPSIEETLSPEGEHQVATICAQFEAAWKAGEAPAIDKFLSEDKEPERSSLLRRLLLIELKYRGQSGETMSRERYHKLFPDHVELIDSLFASAQAFGSAANMLDQVRPAPDVTATRDTAGGRGSTEAGQAGRESRAVQLADVPELPDYEILDLIGHGGMGLVVKARHKVLKRLVAIKLPLPGRMTGEDDRERFLREARSAAGLRHPHICPIYEVGEADGRPYLAMGFIEGWTLDEWAKDRNVSPREIAEVIAALARAVSYAHQRDLVHRDIKPANVMVDAETGNPMLMDFGLAKNLAEEDIQLTQSGQVMGTPVYMAPEQAAGQTEQIGPPADIYALGVVLYELLCGQRPFKGSFGEVLKQVQTSEPTAPRRLKPGLHRDLETICLKAMAKEPARRYESAAALAEDLERFCAGEAIQARREPLTSKVTRKIRRNPLVAASAVVVLMAMVVAGLLASRYVNVQRAATVGREVDARLNKPRLNESYLRETEAKIAELRQLAPGQAADARRRLHRQFESAIREEFRQPTLPPQEVARLERVISLLEKRAPELANPLRQALAGRRRNWQSIFQLAAPYSSASEIFASDHVTLNNSQLVRTHPSDSDEVGGLVLTNQECRGNVELHAVFQPAWSSASEIGLILDGREHGGYRFLLRPAGSSVARRAENATDGDADFSFNAAKQQDVQVSVAIYRGGTVLTETRHRAESLVGGPLHLEARREGNWLTFQVGDGAPLRFRDIFSASSREPGSFGLVWPEDVPLASLQGYRQMLATEASPLEKGDELYLLGRFSEARDHYREQAIASADTPAALEARYKAALCLLAMQRDSEAAELFESVAAQSGIAAESEGDWPLLAACRLWLLRLQQERADEADAVFHSLSSRYRFQELAALVPDNLRRDIIQQYRKSGIGVNLLTFNPGRVGDLERAVQVERFLRVPEISHVHAKRSLVRAYRLAGQFDKAIRFAEEIVSSERVEQTGKGDNLVEEYSWLMRLHGDPQRGLREVDRRLFESREVYRDEQVYLLVERARIHATLGQWGQAAHDLDEFFRLTNVDEVGYHHYSAACLIRGFLREREGDPAGALEAWRIGHEAARVGDPDFLSAGGGSSLMLLLHYTVLSSLSGQLTDADADAIVQKAFKFQSAGPIGAMFQNAIEIPTSVMRQMWHTQRGRRAAEHLAFQDVPLAEYIRLPVLVAASQYVRQNGFGGELSPDDETIVWELAERVYSAYKEGHISVSQVLQLGLTWKGTTSAFGWGGVQGSLEPDLRGPLAYVLGHRYRRLGKSDQAINFFQVAEQDAPADSLVHRRAREEVANLQSR